MARSQRGGLAEAIGVTGTTLAVARPRHLSPHVQKRDDMVAGYEISYIVVAIYVSLTSLKVAYKSRTWGR